jgi:hypothetical protein
MSPEELNVTFSLYTCDNKYKPITFNYKSDDKEILKSTFASTKKTKFVIHGYHGSYDEMGWTGVTIVKKVQPKHFNLI